MASNHKFMAMLIVIFGSNLFGGQICIKRTLLVTHTLKINAFLTVKNKPCYSKESNLTLSSLYAAIMWHGLINRTLVT